MKDSISFTGIIDRFKEEDKILKATEVRYYKKESQILRKQQQCSCLYFIESGLVKMNKIVDGKEFIMRFFSENEFCTVLNSFLHRMPSEYSITSLEDTKVRCISYKELNNLCANSDSFRCFFSELKSLAIDNMMKRIEIMLEKNPEKRYKHFMNENSHIVQRISLGNTASYIGISQVSLSRIRSRK